MQDQFAALHENPDVYVSVMFVLFSNCCSNVAVNALLMSV